MLKVIFKKFLSITLCLLILNLIVYGNTTPGLKKEAQISMPKNNIGSVFASLFGLEIAEDTLPEDPDNSNNSRPQLSEEEVHSLYLHTFEFSFKSPFADNKNKLQEINSDPSSHIPEITPPPPKA